jgi:hypothetical protein
VGQPDTLSPRVLDQHPSDAAAQTDVGGADASDDAEKPPPDRVRETLPDLRRDAADVRPTAEMTKVPVMESVLNLAIGGRTRSVLRDVGPYSRSRR